MLFTVSEKTLSKKKEKQFKQYKNPSPVPNQAKHRQVLRVRSGLTPLWLLCQFASPHFIGMQKQRSQKSEQEHKYKQHKESKLDVLG